jgi:hypothetical protein
MTAPRVKGYGDEGGEEVGDSRGAAPMMAQRGSVSGHHPNIWHPMAATCPRLPASGRLASSQGSLAACERDGYG